MNREETWAATQNTSNAAHRQGMDSPSWLLVGQDGIVEFLTHRPRQIAETYALSHPVDLHSYSELESPPVPIAAASLSGNPLAEPASMDAVMSANAEPAPLMMEQHHGGPCNQYARAHIRFRHTGERVSPLLKNYTTAVPVWHSSHFSFSLFLIWFHFFSLCFVLETVKWSERGVCRTPILCTYITIFLFVCLFCWHHQVMPTVRGLSGSLCSLNLQLVASALSRASVVLPVHF